MIIKAVRVRTKYPNIDERLSSSIYGISDYKIILEEENKKLYVTIRRERILTVFTFTRKNQFVDYSYDDFINEGLNYINSGNQDNKYEIIQDPWQDEPPIERRYGFDPYYLNNGASIRINWIDSDQISQGGGKWSDENGNELEYIPNSDIDKSDINKYVEIWTPSDYNGKYKQIFILQHSEFGLPNDLKPFQYFTGITPDIEILNDIITRWKMEVPNYDLKLCEPNHISNIDIEYISPIKEAREEDNQHIPDNKKDNEIPKEAETPKNLILIIRDEDKKLKIKEDYKIELYIGDAKKEKEKELKDEEEEAVGFIFEDIENDGELDELYREADFDGQEEILSEELIKNETGDDPKDIDTTTYIGEPANISNPFSSVNELYKIADEISRTKRNNYYTGKSGNRGPVLTYQTFSMGYDLGGKYSGRGKCVHGLCSVGSQVIVAALLGIPDFATLGGHADWFSFKNPATDSVPFSQGRGFDRPINGISYYNYKMKVNKDYANNKSNWQVGDILVTGYHGSNNFGHIQVWTGWHWQSDYKQNSIVGTTGTKVNWDTGAVWRLNDNGKKALERRMGGSMA